MSVVRRNLMTQEGYTPYCGNDKCPGKWPRSRFNGKQFECTSCSWQSSFEEQFIKEYKERWER